MTDLPCLHCDGPNKRDARAVYCSEQCRSTAEKTRRRRRMGVPPRARKRPEGLCKCGSEVETVTATHCRACDRDYKLRASGECCGVCRNRMLPARKPSTTMSGYRVCHPCRRWIKSLSPAQGADPRIDPPTQRGPRPSATARGYGRAHQMLRKRLLADFVEGQPCPRCEDPIFSTDPMDLDHTDDRSGYLGLSHAWCNRAKRAKPRPAAFETFDDDGYYTEQRSA